jgi:Cu2+-exporting ATPase
MSANQHTRHALPVNGEHTARTAHQDHEMHNDHAAPAQHVAHGAQAQAAHVNQAPAPHTAHTEHAAHTDHSGHEQMFRKRFWISLALSIPVLLYSPMLQMLLGFTMPPIPGVEWITLALAVIIFVYGGLPFARMAVPEIRNRQPGMMTLISLAISVAFLYSVLAQIAQLGEGFFWELVTLIDVMLLGHWIEMRSVRQASGALNELAKLMPDTAERVTSTGTETVPISRLRTGDVILVRPGQNVAADGEVIEGQSSVNEALITGESQPVKKSPGNRVIGGALNGDGSLRVRVTATGDQTALAGIMRLVEQAQQSKSRTQVLADKAAGWLFYTALIAAALTAIGWTIAVGLNVEVLQRVTTVLVIACPHALGLAIPLVVAITTSKAANNGILVRNRLALESARAIDVVVFDKTGTLTKGQQGLVDMAAVEGWEIDRAVALAAAVESDSEHIVARGLRQAAADRKIALPRATDFTALKGRGIQAQVNDQRVYVGGPNLLRDLNLTLPDRLAHFTHEAERKGKTVVYLIQQLPVAAFALADVIRPESAPAVAALRQMDVEVVMLTGDSQAVAQAVADELHITRFFAGVLPEHKDQKVAELQREGKRVAMVGDGVNDAPALTRADVGIAIGGGTDVAIESAGIILVQSNPQDVVKIVKLSRASYHKMLENLIWATGYNVVAIPLAAGVLAPLGILLSPALGALFMSLSTVIVALNAQLLRRVRLSP